MTDTLRDDLVWQIQKISGGSLDARKGSLAEQVTDSVILPTIEQVRADERERIARELGIALNENAQLIASGKEANSYGWSYGMVNAIGIVKGMDNE